MPPSALGDGQVPCSEGISQRVRLETEQPIWFVQVPWITWSSPNAGSGFRYNRPYPPYDPPWEGGWFNCMVPLLGG